MNEGAGVISNWGPGGGGSYYPEDRYEVGYRDGESNREADVQIFHEEVLSHEPDCGCLVAALLRHLGVYEKGRPRVLPQCICGTAMGRSIACARHGRPNRS